MAKTRLDVLLVDRGLAETRQRAQGCIMAGQVFVNGQRADKPGTGYPEDVRIEVRGGMKYVSRGGYKLERALDFFGGTPEGKVCLDVGASTGGFTDLMLQRGAVHVYAVDSGTAQLAWSLRSDPRVTVMEKTNARFLTPDMFPETPVLAAVDVSFISLALILPAVRSVIAPEGEAFCLVKPQFEAGREKVGRKGVVREPETHLEVLEAFMKNAGNAGFYVENLTWSPIKGPEGNIEFLGHLVSAPCACRAEPGDVVRQAHEVLGGGAHG